LSKCYASLETEVKIGKRTELQASDAEKDVFVLKTKLEKTLLNLLHVLQKSANY
jgi:hypothetical protein